MNERSRVLILDIETSPNVIYAWGKYEQNAIEIIKNRKILSMAYKWLGEKTTHVISCRDLRYRDLIKRIHDVLSEASIVVAHNGDKFDIRRINTEFVIQKLPPPPPYRTVDTRKIAKSIAGFNSNSLSDLAKDMGLGKKAKHAGFDTWKGCMSGDRRSWDTLLKYNKQDVILLEKVYLRLRGWAKNHPNLDPEIPNCPACRSNRAQSRGYERTLRGRFSRLQCQDCGKWRRGAKIS